MTNTDIIERLESAVKANGYRTRDCFTQEEYEAAHASLLSRVEKMEKDNERLAEFARSILRIVFDGGDIDGGTAQDMGVEYGLLERQDFDPKRHTDSTGYAEPGDDWYVFAGALAIQTQEGE